MKRKCSAVILPDIRIFRIDEKWWDVISFGPKKEGIRLDYGDGSAIIERLLFIER
jgi:hypothetical protein